MSSDPSLLVVPPTLRLTRRLLLALGAAAPTLAAGPIVSPMPAAERRVGIGYTLWHTQADWMGRAAGQRPWGKPELGYYVSSDRRVMRQHAEWLSAANVDFVLLDWSNDLGTDTREQKGPSDQLFIENTTPLLFDTWAGMAKKPKIAFLIGIPGPMLRPAVQSAGQDADLDVITAGELRKKADQIHAQYVANARFAPLLEQYLGKPLLVIMIGVPCPYKHKAPTWSDPRFTVRWMTAYLPEQGLSSSDGVSTLGYWSWEDRGPPTYSVYDGKAEAMTVVAAWRDVRPGVGGRKRRQGATYREEWTRARQIGPRYVLAGTFNEWWVSEQISPDDSKDIEPDASAGHTYLDILAQEAALFKQ